MEAQPSNNKKAIFITVEGVIALFRVTIVPLGKPLHNTYKKYRKKEAASLELRDSKFFVTNGDGSAFRNFKIAICE